MRTNSDINLLITNLLQNVHRRFGYVIGCEFDSTFSMVDYILIEHLELL